MLYFFRSSNSRVSLTMGEPIVGFLFILAVPWGIGMCAWAAVVGAISFVLLQGNNIVEAPEAEGFRFAFPVLGALLLFVSLMFQVMCPKSLLSARRERNRAAAAQANLQSMIGEDLSIVRVSTVHYATRLPPS